MKLRDLPGCDGSVMEFVGGAASVEVFADRWMHRGSLFVFDDAAIVSSFDHEIERVTRFPFPLKTMSLSDMKVTIAEGPAA